MQQRADRLVFIGAVFHGDRRHAKDVRDVGDAGALPGLAVMHLMCKDQRGLKPVRRQKRHRGINNRCGPGFCSGILEEDL